LRRRVHKEGFVRHHSNADTRQNWIVSGTHSSVVRLWTSILQALYLDIVVIT
jgi:hypothetical protein